jgi:hypothetical protein
MKMSLGNHGRQFPGRAVLVAALMSANALAQSGAWIKAGDHPNDYDMGNDRSTSFTGRSSGYIRNNKPNPQGFGTYMQMFDATDYRGKRLQFSAQVKSENVENWAGLWMRVDRGQRAVAFDNMQNRPIKGSEGWTPHSIVLDVASDATAVAFGVLLAGKGSVWIDSLAFEVVGEGVPLTDSMRKLPTSPRNLGFDDEPERR